MNLPEILSRFPAFKAWAEKKKLSPREMDILTEFPDGCFAVSAGGSYSKALCKAAPEKAAGRLSEGAPRALPEKSAARRFENLPGALSEKRLPTKSPAPLLEWIARHSPSHSQGAQILELGGELLLMGWELAPLLQKESSSKNLLAGLRSLRRPMASAKARQKEDVLKTLPWPRAMKGQWIRQGDQSGLEIRFQSFSLKDLGQKIKSLERIYKQLEKRSNGLWGDK